MTDVEWIKIQSWHIVLTWTRVPGRALTFCGRRASGETAETLPHIGKSCESCLRNYAWANDPAVENEEVGP